MMFFQIFIKKFASHYSKLQLYEIILKKRISFWRKKDDMLICSDKELIPTNHPLRLD